ncbi:MAG: hypothetical protein A3F74_09410 [Betaproteobacteria bacterium RIFCSPLOWO2_12_FULL_62_58]|nr:MAG: hypothetical protein A3F74_09410 [Betaproteobacteria bacterium RIFCSPLOWO2_12_FULL_62_58]
MFFALAFLANDLKVGLQAGVGVGAYHPDRVANLGKELRDLAERKAKEITEAFREFEKASQE